MTKTAKPYWALLMLLLAGLLPAWAMDAPQMSATHENESIDTIEKLWAGFDPRHDPLEIEVLKEWDEEGIHLSELYFTGETWKGVKTRVYAIQGAPREGKKLPGLLHIHGGGQTAYAGWVRFWAKRGYACVSFDYCGEWQKFDPKRTRYTRWGKVDGNQVTASLHNVTPTPRENPWYHWALTARRALTLLEQHPQVDPDRMGVFGTSMGGTLTWFVAGTDSRVKAAAPIYGVGWNSYLYPHERFGDPVEKNKRLVRDLIEADPYAPRVTCPILFFNATNDQHGNMDRSFLTMRMTASKIKRQVYTPKYIHHINPSEGKNMPLWMDWHLKGVGEPWPQTPQATLALDAKGIPEVRVQPDRPGQVKQVKIYYALNNPWPQSRFWRDGATESRGDGLFAASAPVMHPLDVVYAFANVEYASGVVLTSNLLQLPVADLGEVKPTLKWQKLIDPMLDERDWCYEPAYTDPDTTTTFFRPWRGPDGEQGFTIDPAMMSKENEFTINTHKIADPQWRGGEGMALELETYVPHPLKSLTVKVTEHDWQPTSRRYSAQLPLEGLKGKWGKLKITLDQLKDAQGQSPKTWAMVDYLVLTGRGDAKNTPVFRNLCWVDVTP